ncbi:hypothetical protein TIFTF001_022335 [Ficus carica]|uniref:Uncharacterized protein n=1 Tax=Ficus carica TaxID=3494 RepID=A0AA88AHM1_FICCA|nr:hypothetical protein TIFTF001_022335 [Ficus carica]
MKPEQLRASPRPDQLSSLRSIQGNVSSISLDRGSRSRLYAILRCEPTSGRNRHETRSMPSRASIPEELSLILLSVSLRSRGSMCAGDWVAGKVFWGTVGRAGNLTPLTKISHRNGSCSHLDFTWFANSPSRGQGRRRSVGITQPAISRVPLLLDSHPVVAGLRLLPSNLTFLASSPRSLALIGFNNDIATSILTRTAVLVASTRTASAVQV